MPEKESISIPEANFFDCDKEYKVFEFTDPKPLPQNNETSKEPIDVQRYKFEDDSLSAN